MPWESQNKKADGNAKKTISFANASPPPKKKRDVDKEELMNVKRGGKDENLPQMVRDYILHDRGNSLFLGDSFGNLPSPVAESLTMKKLFKFEDDDRLNKKRKNESKNQAIRVEGKKEKGDKSEEKKINTPERKPNKNLKLDIQLIDKIVFTESSKGSKTAKNSSKDA